VQTLRTYVVPVARLLLASLFLWSGYGKLTDYSGTEQYFAKLNLPVPSVTVWVVIAIEILGGLAIVVGYKTRWTALILALYTLAAGFLVHLPAGDHGNMVNFYKNLSIAGGFLYVLAFGAGIWSLDGKDA
jgi:putative oxidoreductase